MSAVRECTPSVDPALPGLARALDRREMGRRLGALLAGDRGTACRVEVEQARLVRHKPGRRALVEYGLRVAPNGPTRRLLGKLRARGADTRTFGTVRALRAAGLDGRDGVEVPAAVGILPELGMWLQERVDAEPAWAGLFADAGVALATSIADALHRLHAAPLEPRRSHAPSDELRILEERLRSVAALEPAWTPRLERLLEACRLRAASLPAVQPRGIHRDFYPDQVLVGEAGLFLVDLDLYCSGDPALDAGNFAAHLTEWALRRHGDDRALADRENALVERFLELAGRERARAVRVWADLTLARHIEISTRFPDRRPFTADFLALCEARFDLPARPGLTRCSRAP